MFVMSWFTTSHVNNTANCKDLITSSERELRNRFSSFCGLKAAISLAQTGVAFHCTSLQQKDKTNTHVLLVGYNQGTYFVVNHAKTCVIV